MFTCIGRQIEVEDGDDSNQDARDDDVDDVVQRLPLDDQVKSHFLIFVIKCVLPAWLVSYVPLTTL